MVAYVTKAGLGPEPEFALLSVILSVVEPCSTAQRLSALSVLSILLVAELVLFCWPTRVAKCYPAGTSRASLNLDKVFEDAKN